MRMVNDMYRFPFWCGPEPGEQSGDVSLLTTEESQPLYTWRRGYWFEDGTCLKFNNLNIGNAYAIGAWFNTKSTIDNIFGVYEPNGDAIVAVHQEEVSGNWRYLIVMMGKTGNDCSLVSD